MDLITALFSVLITCWHFVKQDPSAYKESRHEWQHPAAVLLTAPPRLRFLSHFYAHQLTIRWEDFMQLCPAEDSQSTHDLNISEAWSYRLLSFQLVPIKTGHGLRRCQKMFFTLAVKLSFCQPPTSSDLGSEKMTSVKCGHPGEGKKLLFSSQSWPRLDCVKLPITGYKTPNACLYKRRQNVQQQQSVLLCPIVTTSYVKNLLLTLGQSVLGVLISRNTSEKEYTYMSLKSVANIPTCFIHTIQSVSLA